MNATTNHEALALVEDTPVGAPAATQQGAALAPSSPAGMMMAMMSRGATLDQIERMMALQMQYEAHEAKKAFVDSMAAFKTEPLTILKRKDVGYRTREGDLVGYSHAELSDVTDVVGPAMAKHGLSYRWDVKQADGRIAVSCIVTHKGGHSESITMDAPPDNSGKKNAIQQTASSVTYLQRYTLLAITGMSTKGMDDDGAGASGATDSEPAVDAVLAGFRAAAAKGEAALRKHYDNNIPSDEFWKTNSKALKATARAADMERAK